MIDFQARVRQRVADLYKTDRAYNDAWAGRVLWLGFEHEVMHLETLLYMLLQSDRTLPPAGTVRPDFEQLAAKTASRVIENEWFDIPEQEITIGIDDPDNADGEARHFGWDVEKPVRKMAVKALKAKARPITNEEYAKYLVEIGKDSIPASWIVATNAAAKEQTDGAITGEAKLQDFINGKAARTVYGPVPLQYALGWPVSASYDELAGCAAYMGGRIPTHEEIRSVYVYADKIKKQEQPPASGKTIPAVNG